jgi:hypothetical protein
MTSNPRIPQVTVQVYLAWQSPRARYAFDRLKLLFAEHSQGRYRLEVINLMLQPHMYMSETAKNMWETLDKLPSNLRDELERAIAGEKSAVVGLTLVKADSL